MQMKMDQVIPAIVEAFLPRFCDRQLGLLLEVDVSYDCYTKSEQHHRKIMQMLIHRPTNYTKVLVREVNFQDAGISLLKKEPTIWEKWADHDSCWNSDGMRCFYVHEQEAIKTFTDNNIPIKNIHPFISFNLFGGIKYVKIEYMKGVDPPKNHSNGYARHWEVLITNDIPLTELHQYLPKED